MGRTVNEAQITTQSARRKLGTRKAPYWRAIDQRMHVGYRKGVHAGSWIGRVKLANGKYQTAVIAAADDNVPSNGETVLDWAQAVSCVRKWADRTIQRLTSGFETPRTKLTVKDILADYLEWFEAQRKSIPQTKKVISVHIEPALGGIVVDRLTRQHVERWLRNLAATPPRLRHKAHAEPKYEYAAENMTPEQSRQRRSSANRALTVLKAALNRALARRLISSNDAWMHVKPYKGVDQPRIHYLSTEQGKTLLDACADDFRAIVRGALETGCRYGELCALRCEDFNSAAQTAQVRESKSGKSRHVPLTKEGTVFFSSIFAGRNPTERMFLQSNGKPWGNSHQNRPLKAAAAAAGIGDVSFHILRHTYASALASKGVPMQVIAQSLGHADTRVAEKHYAHLTTSYFTTQVRNNVPSYV